MSISTVFEKIGRVNPDNIPIVAGALVGAALAAPVAFAAGFFGLVCGISGQKPGFIPGVVPMVVSGAVGFIVLGGVAGAGMTYTGLKIAEVALGLLA